MCFWGWVCDLPFVCKRTIEENMFSFQISDVWIWIQIQGFLGWIQIQS